MRSRALVLVLFTSIVLAVGCGGINDTGGDMGGVSCAPFTNLGGVVTPSTHSGPTPTMTGGTIADGTYALTGWDAYNNETDTTLRQETFVYAGSTMKHVERKSATENLVIAGTYTTAGNMLTWNLQCPMTTSLTVAYTATPTSFAFIAPDDQNRVQTYTRQ